MDRAVLFAYAASAFDEPVVRDAYSAAIDDLVASVRAAPHLGLYGGLAGTAWALCHVVDDAGDALATIDEWLLRALRVERWPGPHDVVHGLAGVGVYFLERLANGARATARDGLAEVVRHLAANATHDRDGVSWRSAPAHLPPEAIAEWPNGYFDCGVAHGAPGVIAVLARAATRLGSSRDDIARVDGVQVDARGALRDVDVEATCDAAIRWVTAQRLAPDAAGDGRFPTCVCDGHAAQRARAAWCYGDPGIAAALWRAAPGLAREIALDSVRRPIETCGVRDAGLCHGAAGLAHLYNRFFHASGDGVFADAARAWFERALAMRRDGGIGGFVAYRGGPGAPREEPNASFLEGAIGTALALLAATSPVEPCWDRLLLCDLPPEGTEDRS